MVQKSNSLRKFVSLWLSVPLESQGASSPQQSNVGASNLYVSSPLESQVASSPQQSNFSASNAEKLVDSVCGVVPPLAKRLEILVETDTEDEAAFLKYHADLLAYKSPSDHTIERISLIWSFYLMLPKSLRVVFWVCLVFVIFVVVPTVLSMLKTLVEPPYFVLAKMTVLCLFVIAIVVVRVMIEYA